jgi:hypothetical protein
MNGVLAFGAEIAAEAGVDAELQAVAISRTSANPALSMRVMRVLDLI